FQSALERDWIAGLGNVAAAPHNPYFHAVPQISAVIAAPLLPLGTAPLAPTLAWGLSVLAFEIVVAFGRADLLERPLTRAVCALSPLLAVGSFENWANTLGAHFYFDVALLLLGLEAPRVQGRRRGVSIAAFAVFAVLSPTAFVLT